LPVSKLQLGTCAIAALLLYGAAAPGSMAPVAGDPVATHSGKISGTRLVSGVRAYLGIPYAKPPVGDLRWTPPQPMQWEGVWNADRTGPECIQVLRPHNINHYFSEEPTGEDCLYLNVWVPPKASASDKLPVVVFIYGGGGTVGSSGMAVYSGERVAEHGAIFVNFNYRVGILGFLAHPELTREQGGHSGNYGYLDQNAALHWVHDNIAAFGGDSAKVVITGQSYGATSVAAQLFSPLSRGLFRAAAMWSACNFTNAAVPLTEAEKIGSEVGRRLNVSGLSELRNVPADKILALQEEHQLGANVQGVRLPPTLDGLFWTQDKAQTLASHQFNDVPIMAGSNGDDLDSGWSPLTKATTVAEFQEAANKLYGAQAAEFLKLFPVRSDADVPRVAHLAARESGFLGQSRNCGDLQAKYNHSASYIELFAHKHSYASDAKIADQNIATIGAYHTADVPFWFGTLETFNQLRITRQWTAQDRTLSDSMMRSLIAFADTGDPATPEVQWPAYTPKQEKFVLFAASATLESLDPRRMDWLQAHPAPLGERAFPARATRD
jgi:para-nitrobenzyl esterase